MDPNPNLKAFISSLPKVSISSLDFEDQHCAICLNAYHVDRTMADFLSPASSKPGTELLNTEDAGAAGSFETSTNNITAESASTALHARGVGSHQEGLEVVQSPAAPRDDSASSAAMHTLDRPETHLGAERPASEPMPSPRASQEKALQLACGHTFGDLCLYQWLSDNATCPVCRAIVVNRQEQLLDLDVDFNVIQDVFETLMICHGRARQDHHEAMIRRLRRILRPAFSLEGVVPRHVSNQRGEHRRAVFMALTNFEAELRQEITPTGMASFGTLMGLGLEANERLFEVFERNSTRSRRRWQEQSRMVA